MRPKAGKTTPFAVSSPIAEAEGALVGEPGGEHGGDGGAEGGGLTDRSAANSFCNIRATPTAAKLSSSEDSGEPGGEQGGDGGGEVKIHKGAGSTTSRSRGGRFSSSRFPLRCSRTAPVREETKGEVPRVQSS